jgi:hypothetical protein
MLGDNVAYMKDYIEKWFFVGKEDLIETDVRFHARIKEIFLNPIENERVFS